MFPDEVFLTLCCPKAEITEAYSIGETAINIPAPADAPIPIEIELASTSLIGDLKDRLNVILGEMAGFSKGEIAELPRMTISTGRKTWLDMDTVKNLIVEVGCLSAIKYGTVTKPRDLVNGAAYGKYLKIDSAFDVLDTAPGPHPPPSCARNLAGRAQKLSHWHAP